MTTKVIKIYISLLFIFSGFSLLAQIPIGSFREHLPYRSFFHVAVSPDKIYASTQKNLMVLDKKNNYEKSTLSKIDGLSEIGIENIFYLSSTDQLLIIYNNANLDFFKNNEIINISDIKNKQIIGSKRINGFLEENKTLYLATGFGVVVIDLTKFLIKDTWFTTLNGVNYQIYGITKHHDKFYVASEKGVFSIQQDDIRIPDFSAWTFETALDTFKYNFIESFGDYLIVNKPGESHDSIFVSNNGEWSFNADLSPLQLRSMKRQNDELAILDWDILSVFDTQLQRKSFYK